MTRDNENRRAFAMALAIVGAVAAVLLLSGCQNSPTANALNAYCDSGYDVAGDPTADQLTARLNGYLQGKGFRGSIGRLDIKCPPRGDTAQGSAE